MGTMHRQAVVPGTIACSAIISACGRGWKSSLALKVLQAVQRHEVVPDVITYSALISACEKGLQPDSALQVFQRHQRQGLVPNAILMNSLALAASNPARGSRNPRLFAESGAHGTDLGMMSYSGLLMDSEQGGLPHSE